MNAGKPIIFLDIASREPRATFAPNPWKTRFALNLKGLPYQTRWVEMPDIAAAREELGVRANRTHPDGSPYHTLPVIQDVATGKVIGDSFEIAMYLDSTYPQGLQLFKPSTAGLTAAFNAQVDGIFTKFVSLCTQMPFDPQIMDKISAMFASRMASLDPSKIPSQNESRDERLAAFELALGELAKAYRHTGGTTDSFFRPSGTSQAQRQAQGRDAFGPFLDGDEPTYSDIIVASWLKMFETSMPAEEWQRIRTWQDGLWGNISDAMKTWSDIK